MAERRPTKEGADGATIARVTFAVEKSKLGAKVMRAFFLLVRREKIALKKS